MNERQFVSRLGRAARAHHRGGWRPALLALDARRASVEHWAERIGRHPLIRRSPKTVYHWARAAAVARSFIPDVGKAAVYLLPVSAWIAIAPYTERGVDRGRLLDMLAAFVTEQVSIEELEATLRETFEDDDDPPSGDGCYPVWRASDTTVQRLLAEQPDTCIVILLGDGWEGQQVRVRVKR